MAVHIGTLAVSEDLTFQQQANSRNYIEMNKTRSEPKIVKGREQARNGQEEIKGYAFETVRETAAPVRETNSRLANLDRLLGLNDKSDKEASR